MQTEMMTQETVLERVRQRLGALEGNAEQAVAEALAILNEPRQAVQPRTEESFVGTNVSFSQYTSWSPEERFQYLNDAKKNNAAWIERQFEKLNADWMMVIDGQVVAHDPDFQNLLDKPEFKALCQKYGKYPFVFFHPRLFMIEEMTAWNATKEPGDAYPTVTVKLHGEMGEAFLAADFDTGATHVYINLNFLLHEKLLTIEPDDYEQESSHLNRSFLFIPKALRFSVQDQNGNLREVKAKVFCIKNWRSSPFVAINPNRTALVGRGLFHRLAPIVHLDFAARQTEIEFHSNA